MKTAKQNRIGRGASELRPITIWLYGVVDGWLPETLRYKVSAGLTDELGPRALFLLTLAGLCEAAVFAVWGLLLGLVRLARRGGPTRL